ncbi:HNH endonuclease [Rhodococcus hoagii]|nr:HNH endonuclease [Prescottella equi]
MFETGVANADADESAALSARHARIAREQFLEIESVADLFVARCEEDARAGRNEARHGEFAHVEVAGILGLTESAAQRMIGLGCDLRWRLHRVRDAFASGRIDLAKAHALAEALANVSDAMLAEIEQRLLDGADRASTTRLKERARRLIARLDPEGTHERRRRAAADRDVRVIARDDAMAEVDGLLPAAGGRILAGRLRAMCFDVCAHDPRTDAQRRADALVALASGYAHLDCSCGREDCTARTNLPGHEDRPARSGVSVQILVGVDASTLLGLDDAPGYLFGHGPIDAELARDLAADGTWKRVLTLTDRDRVRLASATACSTGPVVGVGSSLEAPRHNPADVTARVRKHIYRPGSQLAETVRIRDGGCRFPNCTVPASACDLDHTVAFDRDDPARGGPTTEANLACLCRKHHRLKTLSYWTVRQIGGGRLEWSDPSGRTTVTEPHGPFADAGLGNLHAGIADDVLDRVTDSATLAALNYSRAELDLDFLLDVHIPPRQRRRRGHTPRHGNSRKRIDPGTSPSVTVDDSPPF